MATKAKEAVGSVERILLPRLNSIDGDLKSIRTEIGSVNTRIDEMDRRINTRIDEMDKRIGSRFDAVNSQFEVVDTKIASVESEIRGLSGKFDLIDVERLKTEVAELKRKR